MARSRNIKPGFFKNEQLVELAFETRLLFAGLWTLADREGRLEDRPKKIKMELFPADSVDVDSMLTDLHDAGLIARYESAGQRCIEVTNFAKHQKPHPRETESVIPAREAVESRVEPGQKTGSREKVLRGRGKALPSPASSLNPSSLNPESLTPAEYPPGLDPEAWERWVEYRTKIRKPIKPVSMPAAQRKLAGFGADQARVVEESIANGWQGLFEPKDKPQAKANGTGGPKHWI